MPNQRGRGSDRTLTRRRLLDAAADVFAERGFHDATLEEIVEQAGFTRGAFYSNFASKDELFLAMIEDQNRADAATTGAYLRAGATPLEVALSDPMPADQRRRLDLVRLEFLLYCARRKELQKQLRGGRETRKRLLADQVASAALQFGAELPMSTEDAADLILAVNTEAQIVRLFDPGDDSKRESMYRALFEMLGFPSDTKSKKRPRKRR